MSVSTEGGLDLSTEQALSLLREMLRIRRTATVPADQQFCAAGERPSHQRCCLRMVGFRGSSQHLLLLVG